MPLELMTNMRLFSRAEVEDKGKKTYTASSILLAMTKASINQTLDSWSETQDKKLPVTHQRELIMWRRRRRREGAKVSKAKVMLGEGRFIKLSTTPMLMIRTCYGIWNESQKLHKWDSLAKKLSLRGVHSNLRRLTCEAGLDLGLLSLWVIETESLQDSMYKVRLNKSLKLAETTKVREVNHLK